jgi:hypothetical protein
MVRECPEGACKREHECSGPCGVNCSGHFCDCVEV